MEDVTTQFSYFQWKDLYKKEKPYYLYIDHPEDMPRANFETSHGPVETVRNLRGLENQFNLDDNGFTVKHQQFSLEVINQETVTKQYLPSLEKLINETIGEDCEIVWFDWRVRPCPSKFQRLGLNLIFAVPNERQDEDRVCSWHSY